ncbi:hypothetical protein [Luteipulveratus mongoliensis]|uniref:hypothetical protein n=1 Tax=Luteipulveratus mongoliensis TaxID=571913 RepID=UPI0006980534|nr:hypothetical protein [Luteipulveratus mongoliensis]
MSHPTRAARAAVVALALAGAFGLSACQDEAPAAGTTNGGSTASSTGAPAGSETAAPTDESTGSDSTATDGGSAGSGDGQVATKGTKLKFGQPAVVREGDESSDDSYKLTAKSLEIAPDSVYAAANLNKANGKVYYLRYEVTNIGKASGSSFDASDVNSFMFTPKLAPGQEGKKLILSGDADKACENEDKALAVGQTGQGCEPYQITGDTITDVVFAPGGTIDVTWSK